MTTSESEHALPTTAFAHPPVLPHPQSSTTNSTNAIINNNTNTNTNNTNNSTTSTNAVGRRASRYIAPIDIPGASERRTSSINNSNNTRPLTPLPLLGLYKLDKHAWDSTGDVLGRWAAGIGIGPPTSPGSPPRQYRPSWAL